MAENTAIEWTDATWNPVTGCTKISPGAIGALPSFPPVSSACHRLRIRNAVAKPITNSAVDANTSSLVVTPEKTAFTERRQLTNMLNMPTLRLCCLAFLPFN